VGFKHVRFWPKADIDGATLPLSVIPSVATRSSRGMEKQKARVSAGLVLNLVHPAGFEAALPLVRGGVRVISD